MKIDIHFTTCHHTSVKCRPRTNDYNIEGFNITPWTLDEKLKIAQTSLISFKEFCVPHPVTVIDDGSNIPDALNWFSTLNNHIYSYPHSGTAAAINAYMAHLSNDVDLIFHSEDDHVWYNPEKLDWATLAYEFLINNPDIGVVCFRSGFPSEPTHPDIHGAWGPIGWRESSSNAILYKAMGNSHHLMLRDTYEKFLPLQGNAGSCEAYMNRKLRTLGLLSAELQIPVYAFHSHCYEREVPYDANSVSLNMSPRGIEYGIKNMYELLKKQDIPYYYYHSKPIWMTY